LIKRRKGEMVNKGAIGSIVGLAVLVALLAAGCGGGSEETVTKSDFVRQGNAVCGKWQQARGNAFQEVNSKFKPPITQAKREKAILYVLEPYGDAIQGLQELDPPAGEEEKVEAMIKAMEEAFDQAQANPGSLISSTAAFNKSNQLVEDYGLKECKV
jgi:hypothetical protein